MTVITPFGLLVPPPERDLHIVRGDRYEFSMGFTGRPDVVADPAQFRLRLVFRRRQVDALPDLLVVQATLDTAPADSFQGQPLDVLGTFVLEAPQTQALPAAGCVYFIEWTDAIGGANKRIVQGRVRVGD